jgi:hypothetical protein
MKKVTYLLVGGISVILIVLLFFVESTKAKLQSLYLGSAKINGPITWYDAYCVKCMISTNQPVEKCIRIGREQVNGRNVMYVFTLLNLYELVENSSGKWELKNKGFYVY